MSPHPARPSPKPHPLKSPHRHKHHEPGETKLGPLTLDWKVNVTAVVAFFVSVSALLLQAFGYWQGAIISLHQADKLYIANGASGIRVGTRMVYTNDGATGYNALVLAETVSLKIGRDEYHQWAETRGAFDVTTDRKSIFQKEPIIDAAPFAVPAMQLVTHETFFAPRERGPQEGEPWADRISREQFVQLLKREHKNATKTIAFVFDARTRQISGRKSGEESVVTTTCVITLDDGLIDRMENEGWASRSCHRGEKPVAKIAGAS